MNISQFTDIFVMGKIIILMCLGNVSNVDNNFNKNGNGRHNFDRSTLRSAALRLCKITAKGMLLFVSETKT